VIPLAENPRYMKISPPWRALPVAVPVAALLVAALLAAPAAARQEPQRVVDIEAEDCEENVPVATAANLVDPGGAEIRLDVLVLLDGIPRADAEAVVAKAAESWIPTDVALTATYKKLVPGVVPPTTTPPSTTADAGTLIADAKKAVGGQRPTGTDAVYLMTAKDITMEGNPDVAGYADCIGGVRYPTRAFATGEGVDEIVELGLRFYVDGAAKLLSHELGHLLGARHDYSNCVEGASAEDVTNRDPSICTLMTDNIDFMDLHFGSFEAIVVRGHAESFARP